MEIHQKLLLPSAIAWLIFFVMLNLYWKPAYLQEQQVQLLSEQKQTLQLLGLAVAGALSKQNFGFVSRMLDDVLARREYWKGLILRTSSGKEIRAISTSVEFQFESLSSDFNRMHYEIILADEPEGVLELAFDLDALSARQRSLFLQLDVVLVVLAIIVLIAGGLLGNIWIRRPLVQLADAADTMASGQYDVDLPRNGSGEIARLMFSFSTMSNNLRLALDLMEEETQAAKKAADSLRKSQALINSILDNSPELISIIDLDGRIICVSQRFSELLGISVGDVVGKNIMKLLPARFARALWGQYADGDADRFEQTEEIITHEDGSAHTYLINCFSLTDEAGRVYGSCAIATDITEQKKIVDALSRSDERFSIAVRATNEGIWDWDMETGEMYYSPHWKGTLGYEDNEFENTFEMWQQHVHPDDLGSFLVAWSDYMEGRTESFSQEYRIRNKAGEYLWVLCRGLAQKNNKGMPIRLIGSQFDVTENRMLEKQIRQAQKMEGIGHLTGGIAHDFNNILASILGYAELAKESCTSAGEEEIGSYLQEIYASGVRARNLVRQMLAFSRGGDVEREARLLVPMLKDMMNMLRPLLPSTIKLNTDFENPNFGCQDIAIYTDPEQLSQLVMNLCINARDAMNGSGVIDIDLSMHSDVDRVCASCHEKITGNWVRVSIQDTGTGIDPVLLERLFDPFFSTKAVGKGTGMGLSIVHGIMHRHDGHVIVDTTPGKGTIFELLFPPSDLRAKAVAGIIETEEHDNISVGNGCAMIIDDEEAVGRYIGELLSVCGFEVSIFSDSRLALMEFMAHPENYNLVVTDQVMPEVTGIELAQAMLHLRPELKIILCSGYSEQVDQCHVKELGIAHYFVKPLSSDKLLNRINDLFELEKFACVS